MSDLGDSPPGPHQWAAGRAMGCGLCGVRCADEHHHDSPEHRAAVAAWDELAAALGDASP